MTALGSTSPCGRGRVGGKKRFEEMREGSVVRLRRRLRRRQCRSKRSMTMKCSSRSKKRKRKKEERVSSMSKEKLEAVKLHESWSRLPVDF